jgi:hypothetical protein
MRILVGLINDVESAGGPIMKRAKWLFAVGLVIFLLLAVVIGAPFFGPLFEVDCPCAQTQRLLNMVFSSTWYVWQEGDGGALVNCPSGCDRPNVINSHVVSVIVDEKALIDRGGLEGDSFISAQGDVLLDAWGRPLVFQAPSVYPNGVTCLTSDGSRRVRPLPESLWNSERYGPIQIWSLGPNGVDDRGEGDDILPDHVQAGSRPGTPVGPLPPRSEPT